MEGSHAMTTDFAYPWVAQRWVPTQVTEHGQRLANTVRAVVLPARLVVFCNVSRVGKLNDRVRNTMNVPDTATTNTTELTSPNCDIHFLRSLRWPPTSTMRNTDPGARQNTCRPRDHVFARRTDSGSSA